MVTRKKIIEKAREYLDTPYRHQGRCKGAGVDCVGLIVCIAKELNIILDDTVDYPRIPNGDLISEVQKRMIQIPIDKATAGDVLMVYVNQINIPQHLLLLTQYGIIHAFDGGLFKVCETTFQDKWRRRVVAAFQFPNIED